MLDRIKEFFRDRSRTERPGAHSFDELQFAAAALLAEAAMLDGDPGDAERARMTELLAERFALTGEEAGTLVAAAEARMQDTHQIHPFVRAIKDGFDDVERIRLVEMMWEVIYVDGRLHEFEANLMRRIGGLINVTDIDIGSARRRVLARRAAADGNTDDRGGPGDGAPSGGSGGAG